MGSKLIEDDLESPSPKIVAFSDNIKFNFKHVLTLTDVLNIALKLCTGQIKPKLIICQFGKLTHGKKKKVRINPLYGAILAFIKSGHWRNHCELYREFSSVKPRTLRGYLKELQELKWLRRHGRDYHLNPFLYDLIDKFSQAPLLFEYAPLKIDFFDILNVPLLNSLKRRVTKVDMDYFEVKDNRYFREIFRGVLFIDLCFENGQKAETILPLNLHGQPIYGKKEYLEHYCIPLKWRLFGIQKASFYSTNYRRSHRKGANNKPNDFIHFDNSISLLFQPKGRFYMLWEKKFFERRKTSIKHWQNYEYLEVSKVEVLKRLFTKRFVNGKKGLALFKALGMEYKPISGRPEKQKATSRTD